MKNYYKRVGKEQRMMVDTENRYAVRLYPGEPLKSITLYYNDETIDGFINETSDNTVWSESTEVDFNNIKDQIISLI
jgi:hypothetical protein